MNQGDCLHGPSTHVVQFYDNDSFLADCVAGFIGEGIRHQEGAIVLATPEHLAAIGSLLQEAGVHTQGPGRRYFPMDAEEALSGFMVHGVPDSTRFKRNMSRLISQATPPGKRLRIYGEMVAVLWAQGNREAALKVEALWNELAHEHSFALLCGYHMDAFKGQSHENYFQRVCGLHSHVMPVETDVLFPESIDVSRSIALLQQRSLSLDVEIRKRKHAEIAARLEKAKLQMAIDLTGMGVWEVDIATRKEFWSESGKALFGVEAQDGFSCQQMLACIHVEDRELVGLGLRESLEIGTDFQVDFRVCLPSGDIRWISALGRRFDLEKDCLVTLLVDVTERNEAAAANRTEIPENISDENFLTLLQALKDLPNTTKNPNGKRARPPDEPPANS